MNNQPKRRRVQRDLLASAILATLAFGISPAVLAQDAQEEDASTTAQPATNLDKVTVTGSRIKRVDIEGPTPVTVVTAEDIQAQGFNTVYEALNTLTQNDIGRLQNELTAGSFTQGAQFVSLRGLGPSYQLVLINGRRVADYPHPYNGQSNAINVGSIPAAAVERIEVLTGGASAIYGSDAVAGVINIILKTNYEGDLVTLRGGTTTEGGGDSGRVQWVGGKTGERWGVNYAFEYLHRDTIWASQRDFMDSYRDDPSVDPNGFVPAVEGIRLTIDGVRWWPDGFEENCARFPAFEAVYNPNLATNNERCYYYGYPATQTIRNQDENLSAYVYGTFDITDNLQAWGQVNYVQSEVELAMGTQFISGNLGGGTSIQRIFTPDEVGGKEAQAGIYDEKSYDLAAGLRGTVFDGRFDWDFTLSHSKYVSNNKQPWFVSDRLLGYFFTDQGFDLDRYFNPLTPAAYNSMIDIARTDAESKSTQAQFVLSGDLFDLPAGPVGFAAVVEGVSSEYSIRPDARLLPTYAGDDAFWNLTATQGGGERDRYAFGVETSIPVLASLKASLAARYDKYDDVTAVDDAVTWSAGLEWRPFDNLLVRGAYATSFRAPDLHYVYAQESGFYTEVFDEYRCRRDGFDPRDSSACNDSEYVYEVFGMRRGSTDLEEEKGKSWSAGVVWDITDDLSFTVDWYKVRLEGGVADINRSYLFRQEAACLLGTDRDGSPVDTTGCGFFTGLIQRDPDAGDEVVEIESFPINQSMLETEGVDASVRYQLDTDRLGEFGFNLGWSHTLKYEDQLFPGSEIRELRDNKQFFNFRSRVNWGVDWRKDDWTATLYGYRWGSLPNWAETGRIAPYLVWNASVKKDITRDVSLSFLVTNIFNNHHPKDDTFNTYPFFWRAYDAIGREVFAQVDFRF